MNAPLHTPRSATVHERSASMVTRLQQSQLFRDYQDAFQTATGLPLVLRAADSFQAPLHGAKKVASLCVLMRATNRTCAACLKQQARVESQSITGSKTLECFAGLSESMVPVRVGERLIAYLQTGQVFLRSPTEKTFLRVLAGIAKWDAQIDVALFRDAYFETRVLTRKYYGAVLRLLENFAHHLSLVSNELMITQNTTEPPAVAKARAFIAENLGEDLSLEQVAHAANMSAYYFCKVFKGATGVTFTDYVARARIEQIKHLLLNPQIRVSEAAYEAGFQSLSQFNRVFRRIEGQSPSKYRHHLQSGENGDQRPARTFPFAA